MFEIILLQITSARPLMGQPVFGFRSNDGLDKSLGSCYTIETLHAETNTTLFKRIKPVNA